MWWYRENEIEISYLTRDFHPMTNFHVHENEELVLVEQGSSTIITENNLEEASGQFLIRYPSGMAHQQHNDPCVPYIVFNITYKKSCLDGMLPAERQGDGFCVLPLDKPEFQRLETYARMLLNEFRADDADIVTLRLRRRCLLALICGEVAWLESQKHPAVTKDYGPIHDICQYIRDHCTEPLTLDSIASHFYISRSKLVRSFRATLNLSVYEYLCRARIGSSLSMLRDGKSVKEVAIACGFSSAEYYTKVFRKKVGCTPSEYRTQTQM